MSILTRLTDLESKVSKLNSQLLAARRMTSKIGARAYRATSVQAINHITWTKILFNAEDWDYGGGMNADGVNSEYTVKRNGIYIIGGSGQFATFLADKVANIAVFVNNANRARRQLEGGATGGVQHRGIDARLELAVDDVVDIRVWHNCGVAKNIGFDAVGSQTWFEILLWRAT